MEVLTNFLIKSITGGGSASKGLQLHFVQLITPGLNAYFPLFQLSELGMEGE